MQQYAHLHRYNGEEQDNKVRRKSFSFSSKLKLKISFKTFKKCRSDDQIVKEAPPERS